MSGVELGILAVVVAGLFAALAWWRRRSTDVIGVPPPPVAAAGSPARLSDQVPHRWRGSSIDDAASKLMEAAKDGLSDAEIEAIFPGSEVRRTVDGVEIRHVETTSRIRALGPDGITDYASIDEIPDPEVREKLRRMMDGSSAESPPEP